MQCCDDSGESRVNPPPWSRARFCIRNAWVCAFVWREASFINELTGFPPWGFGFGKEPLADELCTFCRELTIFVPDLLARGWMINWKKIIVEGRRVIMLSWINDWDDWRNWIPSRRIPLGWVKKKNHVAATGIMEVVSCWIALIPQIHTWEFEQLVLMGVMPTLHST